MTRLTIEIPDELVSQLEHTGYSVQEFVVKALERYIQAELPTITQTRTRQLCGSLEVANPTTEYIVGRDEKAEQSVARSPRKLLFQEGKIITNYAEKVDDVLY